MNHPSGTSPERAASTRQKFLEAGARVFVQEGYVRASMELVVRVGPDYYQEALAQPYVRLMDITGRPMKGWVFVGHDAIDSDEDLARWMGYGLKFAGTLPPK